MLKLFKRNQMPESVPAHTEGAATANDKTPSLVVDRSLFEAFWISRGVKGEKSTLKSLERDANDDYCDDSTQRHWWTWQNALKYSNEKA
jgi:hypothetical protein